MISDDQLDEIQHATMAGDEQTLERLARQHAPVELVIFLASMGGGAIHDDAGLIERVG